MIPHRWSLAHNYLAGITAGEWWRLLRENRFDVDVEYLHRAVFVTVASLVNSWWRRREEDRYGGVIDGVEVPAPLIIVGHWRSGTTHLHNLLSLDREQFAYPSTYEVVNPHTFLLTEERHAKLFGWMVPPRRPMDNMALSFASPQEDEFAPCLMSLRSLYLGVSFPRREEYYEKYLTFAGAEEEGDEWGRALVRFVKKLTLKHGLPLLLKSPPHTARIRRLLGMFPGARFVHIHRDPCEVYQSFRRYYDTAVWHTYLQRPDRGAVEGRILSRYRVMHDAWFGERDLIPAGRLHEVRFADLERDPVGEVGRIYEALGLEGYGRVEPVVRAYAEEQRGYCRNEYGELGEEERVKVVRAWERNFDIWGYPKGL